MLLVCFSNEVIHDRIQSGDFLINRYLFHNAREFKRKMTFWDMGRQMTISTD